MGTAPPGCRTVGSVDCYSARDGGGPQAEAEVEAVVEGYEVLDVENDGT